MYKSVLQGEQNVVGLCRLCFVAFFVSCDCLKVAGDYSQYTIAYEMMTETVI